jgi:hypothetical protein
MSGNRIERPDVAAQAAAFLRAHTVEETGASPLRSADHDRGKKGVQLTRGAADAFARLDPAVSESVLAQLDADSRRTLLAAIEPLQRAAPARAPVQVSDTAHRAGRFAQGAPPRTDPKQALAALRDFSQSRNADAVMRLARADAGRLATLDGEERENLRADLLGVLLRQVKDQPVSAEAEETAALLLASAPDRELAKQALLSAIADGSDGSRVLENTRHPELRGLVEEVLREEGSLALPSMMNERLVHANVGEGSLIDRVADVFRRVVNRLGGHEQPGGGGGVRPPGQDAQKPGTVSGSDQQDSRSNRTGNGKIRVDWSWITGKEGGRLLKGYVPHNKDGTAIGASGVTVATGVDLGQWNEAQLRALGLPEDLIAKLRPYLSPLRKEEAIAYLEEHPLTLTADEAALLDTKMREHFEKNVSSRYNATVKALRDSGDPAYANLANFEDLPPEMQTAIVSLAYQYGLGSKGRIKTSGLWHLLASQQWARAAELLTSDAFDTRFEGRRTQTAGLIREGAGDTGVA